MSDKTEAFARTKIDALLKDAGWNLTDDSSVLFEHALADGSRADYVLCDRQGRPMAVLEAKRASIDPITAQDQGRHYAELLGAPFVFLSNGEEVRFLDRETDAHARLIAGFFAQDDLERRMAARQNRRDISTVNIDRRIVDRDYQIECIEALSAEVSLGHRKLLVEMATAPARPARLRPSSSGCSKQALLPEPCFWWIGLNWRGKLRTPSPTICVTIPAMCSDPAAYSTAPSASPLPPCKP